MGTMKGGLLRLGEQITKYFVFEQVVDIVPLYTAA
jgi:hypothetical protein